MKRIPISRSRRSHKQLENHRVRQGRRSRGQGRLARPPLAYRQRGGRGTDGEAFNAPEDWHEPQESGHTRYVVQEPGHGYVHPVTVDEVSERLEQLPQKFTCSLEVVQLSRMTRKRALFPCYGMQWGPNIYLYPIEESLVETYVRPPLPQQLIEARMYGGRWSQDGEVWRLEWTWDSIRDFYLNNILIHEVGHVNDDRNRSFDRRERYADWFAVEYGYRASRGRRRQA